MTHPLAVIFSRKSTRQDEDKNRNSNKYSNNDFSAHRLACSERYGKHSEQE
jgi:hypothetical protein